MTSTKYIGMDVHKESISTTAMNASGKIVMECVIETKASTINGAVATRVWNHREEETFLRFTRRNEISDSALSKTTLESRVHVQKVGLNAEQSIKVSASSRRGGISLDIPFNRRLSGPLGWARV